MGGPSLDRRRGRCVGWPAVPGAMANPGTLGRELSARARLPNSPMTSRSGCPTKTHRSAAWLTKAPEDGKKASELLSEPPAMSLRPAEGNALARL